MFLFSDSQKAQSLFEGFNEVLKLYMLPELPESHTLQTSGTLEN